DLRERAELAADGDERVGRPHDEDVARLAEAGGDRDIDPRIRVAPVESGEQADGRTAGGLRAAAGGLHDAAEAAADDPRARSCEQTADLLRERRARGITLASAHHRDESSSASHAQSKVARCAGAYRAGSDTRVYVAGIIGLCCVDDRAAYC